MNQYFGLILTLIAGLFFLIGGLISLKVKNKDKLNAFSIALALVIIINLLAMDLIPEILELLEDYDFSFKIMIILIFGLLGIFLLKIFIVYFVLSKSFLFLSNYYRFKKSLLKFSQCSNRVI